MAKKDPETKKPAKDAPAKDAPAPDAAAAAPKATGPKKPQVVPIHGPDSIIDRLQPHIKKIAVGALALFVVIGGFVGWRWMKHRKDNANTIAVDSALQIARARVVSPTDTPPPPDPNAPPPDDGKTYPSSKERAAAAADAMAKAGKAADRNALFQAGLLLDAGKLDEAEALYKAHAGDDGIDGALAREGVGYVIEARAEAAPDDATRKKLYADALDAYKQVQTDDKGPRYDVALYDQARMYQAIGKTAEAKAALDSALKAVPKTALKSEIEARQALLGAP